MSLRDTQAALFEWVTGTEPKSLPASDFIAPGALSSAEAHADVYAQMYRLRARDSLREDFKALTRVLPEETFHALVDAYLVAHPSTHHDLARLGHAWADFLSRHDAFGLPAWGADLARLEWARAEAFVAVDSPVVSASAPSALGPQRFVKSRLVLAPCVRVVSLTHDVLPVWDSREATQPTSEASARTFSLVVWRKGWQVYHAEISIAEARGLTLALAGATVEALCECFAGEEDPAAAAFAALGSWFSEGMVAALEAP